MRITVNSFFIMAISLSIASCGIKENSKSNMDFKTIMEVTTFNINADVNPLVFAKRDLQVESDFTAKQAGFIKRQSAVDEKGNYAVIVYWKTMEDAEASMSKFMDNKSVVDYAQMIDGSSMKMSRYTMNKPFEAKDSRFVEIMSFDLKSFVNLTKFSVLNQNVETDFTAKRNGFLQRLTGVNEMGKQVIAVYWESKATSDASLQPFMESPISQKFMKKMDQASVVMGRYKLLNF